MTEQQIQSKRIKELESEGYYVIPLRIGAGRIPEQQVFQSRGFKMLAFEDTQF